MNHPSHSKKEKKQTVSIQSYKPLILIVTFCLVLAFTMSQPFSYEGSMYLFMGFFFTFLSLFKLFDINGFVDGFSTYDLITKYVRPYGYAYPFIELFLGLSYLGGYYLGIVNWVTVIVMLVSGIGTLKSVMDGKKIKCACLGTTLNVPLTSISVVENVAMGLMAAYKLF